MRVIWILACKDLQLLLRDTRSTILLLVMPLLFVAVLGVAVGEGFGQKPDDRLRISVVNLDEGLPTPQGETPQRDTPQRDTPQKDKSTSKTNSKTVSTKQKPKKSERYPGRRWSEVVIEDLANTAGIRIEVIQSTAEAEDLIRRGRRAAILVFEKNFSEQMNRCSFLTAAVPPPLNPLYRDGIHVNKLGLTILKDNTQSVAASIIEQVAQVTLLRVVIPWMIGRAFERIGDEEFMKVIGRKIPGYDWLPNAVKKQLGPAVQLGIADLFSNYDFYAKTWAGLTRSEEQNDKSLDNITTFASTEGSGLLKRGAMRYQILVPSYTVMFSFFLVLTVGWLFSSERRNGTLVRLRAAPITKLQILLGKFFPCLIMSLFQGLFLLLCGKIIFGMNWGNQPLWVILVVFSTSVAAMGLAMLVTSIAKTEGQVAIYGTILVLVLGGLSGSMMPRDLMPEEMKKLSFITPHAWALDCYSQLLMNPQPDLVLVTKSCMVLISFGVVFLILSWLLIRFD